MDLLALPKTELHLHLEGAMPQQTLLQLAHKYGGADEVPDLEALQAKFRYRDFAHFIATWVWMVGYLREYDDFRLIATSVARDGRAARSRNPASTALYRSGRWRGQVPLL